MNAPRPDVWTEDDDVWLNSDEAAAIAYEFRRRNAAPAPTRFRPLWVELVSAVGVLSLVGGIVYIVWRTVR